MENNRNTKLPMTFAAPTLPGVGVCVGRFQTPDLHDGHLAILREVSKHSLGIVFVGVAGTPMTKQNPMDFVTRKLMIQNAVGPNVSIVPIADHQSDETWSENLDRMIRTIAPFGKVHFYHSRDSFVEHYHGSFKTFVKIPAVDNVNATSIRAEVGSRPLASAEFRAGVIYASQNMYPRVQPTVDVAVVDLKAKKVLLGRKPGVNHLCFIGGFIDMHEENAVDAALRELGEETGISIPSPDYEHIITCKINDWRDTTNTSVMTTFYMFKVNDWQSIKCKAADDIEELVWCDINVNLQEKVGAAHKILASNLWFKVEHEL